LLFPFFPFPPPSMLLPILVPGSHWTSPTEPGIHILGNTLNTRA